MRAAEVTRPAALLLCMMSLITLDGCAPVILRTPSATHTEESGGSAETIRTLSPDQQFVELPIASVAERAQTTYVITNNHFESKAGVNALELKAMVTGKRVPAPPTLIQKYPELRRFADPGEGTSPQLPLLA